MAERGRPHVVIVGAGFGGLFAARSLARAPVWVTVVDRTNHHLFQPLLYQVASGVLAPEDIAVPIRSVVSGQGNARVVMGEVTALDPQRRQVTVEPGPLVLGYDVLILATGSRHGYFGAPEWEPWAPGLKTLADALEVRRRILAAFEAAERDAAAPGLLPTFVVVGGGPTGVELAGALAQIARRALARDFRQVDPRRSRILLAEAGPRLLPAFHPSLSSYAARYLLQLGVEVLLRTPVTAVGPNRVRLGEGWIAPALVLWAAGNEASPLGRFLGVPLVAHGRVRVNPDLSVPGHPEVFVVGDLAAVADTRGELLPAVAPVATQEGRHAAAMITRRLAGRPTVPFRYRNHGQMATLGRRAAVAEIGPLRLTGRLGWSVWLSVHIFALIGFSHRLQVLIRWAAAYWADRPGARILVAAVKVRRDAVAQHPPPPSA